MAWLRARKRRLCQLLLFFLDERRGGDGSRIYRTRNFDYPLQRTRDGSFRVRPGELIRVCMTSDFFLPEADAWREGAWDIMRQRPDVRFWLLTKRPERIASCLPADWGVGWDHVSLNVSAENQRRADERLPLLLSIPAKHRGVMCAPLIGEVSLGRWLADGALDQVIAGGENYGGARPCNFDWIRRLRSECEAANTTFTFIETGSVFVKDGRTYRLRDKQLQSEQAFKSGMSFAGRPIVWHLRDSLGLEIPEADLYQPVYDGPQCDRCGSRPICNGCSHCGACSQRVRV